MVMLNIQTNNTRIIELSRNKKTIPEEAAMELELHYSTDIWLTEQIAEDLKTYKDNTGMIEYLTHFQVCRGRQVSTTTLCFP